MSLEGGRGPNRNRPAEKMNRTFEFLALPDLVLFFPDNEVHYKVYKVLRNMILGLLAAQGVVEIDSVTVLEFCDSLRVTCYRPSGVVMEESQIRDRAIRIISDAASVGWIS